MTLALEWREPKESLQWQWQAQDLPIIRGFLGMISKWAVILGVPAFLAVYLFTRSDLLRLMSAFIAIMMAMAADLAVFPWLSHTFRVRRGVRYLLSEQGVSRDGQRIYPLSAVQSYYIGPHPHLSDIRVLELQPKHDGSSQKCFNLAETDEERVRQGLHHYLPGCEMDSRQ